MPPVHPPVRPQAIHTSLRRILSGGLLLGAAAVMGQPICTLDLGADRTVCQGNSITLSAPPGFANHLWSTGAITPSINVSAGGNYTLWAVTGQDMIVNGDFSAGNTGFSTPFSNNSNLNGPGGRYFIGNNASNHHPGYVGTSTGNFMMVNATAANNNWNIWCQTVDMCPGQTYNLSFSVSNLANGTPPGQLAWFVDGSYHDGWFNPPQWMNQWFTFTTTLVAPTSGTADICLRLQGANDGGSDLGIDNIRLVSTTQLTDQVHVDLIPRPTPALPATITRCAGTPIPVDATVPGGTAYLWSDGTVGPQNTLTSAGQHEVLITANGCQTIHAVNVIYTPLPPLDLGNDVEQCEGTTVTFSAFLPGATYVWSNGATTPTITTGVPGTYSVTVTRGGCSSYDEVQLATAAMPTVALGGDISICAGTSAIIGVTAQPGTTYLWDDLSVSSTRLVSAAGTYTLEATLGFCSATDDINVSLRPLPVVDLGNDTTICQGNSIELTGTPAGATYVWSTGEVTPTITVSTADTYSVTVTANNCSATDAIDVDVAPPPSVYIGPDMEICAGSSITLDATTSGAGYLWSNGATSATITVDQPDTYSVQVDMGGCTATDDMELTTRPLPVVNVADATICPGGTATLVATTPGASYLWSDGTTDPTLTVNSPGSYSVQVTVNGCSTTATAEVNELALHSVDLGPDLDTCIGTTVPLSINLAGATYVWNTGSTDNTINAGTQGWYWVDVSLNTCTVRDSLYLTVTDPGAVGPWSAGPVCTGATTSVDVTTASGTAYLWDDGTIGPVNTVGVGPHGVTITIGGCQTSGIATVTEFAPLLVTLGNDTTLCPGADIVLTPGSGWAQITWGDGSGTPTFTVDHAGQFTVEVEDAHGCTANATIQVDYADPGSLSLGNDTTLCTGHFVMLDGTVTGASGYLWNNGSTGNTLLAGGIGTYWVDVTIGNCLLTDSIHVNTVAPPQVHLGNDTTLCPGATIVLDPGFSGLGHLWQNGSTANQFTVTTTGTYSVTVTNGNGCTGSDAIVVTVLDVLALDLGNDTLLCPGNTLTLNATTAGAGYLWSTGATTPQITVGTSGQYAVDVLLQGCSFSASIDVEVVDLPGFDLGNDQLLCSDASLQLTVNTVPTAAILWDDGTTATTRTVNNGGAYWARTTIAHCSVSDTIHLTEVQVPVVELGNDTSLCTDATLVLNAQWPGATYLWNNGATSATLTAVPGNWNVVVTSSGCSASDAISIDERPLPVVVLPVDTAICAGSSLLLDVTQPGATYLWSDGAVVGSRSVNTAGTYGVTVDLAGCTASDAVTVSVTEYVPVELGPDTTLCPGASLTLSVVPQGAAITWSTGAHAAQLTVGAAGTYAVVLDKLGCISTDQITVDVTPVPVPALGPDLNLCEGDTAWLQVDAAAALVTWQDGSVGNSYRVIAPGLYRATVTLDGCSLTDAVQVDYRSVVRDTPLPDEVTLCPGEDLVLSAELPMADYRWNTGSTHASITVTGPGLFTVAATGICIDALDTVRVVHGACDPLFHVPNAFTPDGDGWNDLFIPVYLSRPLEYRLRIFDRWGVEVFTTEAPEMGWDGQFKGTEVPDGVYVWTIRYRMVGNDGVRSGDLKGHVTLLR